MSNEATISFKGSSSCSYEQLIESSDDNTQSIVTHIIGSPEYIYPWPIISTYKSIVKNLDSNFFQAQKDRLIFKINQFAELEKDWNGYEAIAINKKTKFNAINIIKEFNSQAFFKFTSIFPYPHGTVGFKWRNKVTGEIASLEIGQDSFSCYSKKTNQPVVEFDGTFENLNIVKNLLKKLELEIEQILPIKNS